MKTPEQWMAQLSGSEDAPAVCINRQIIREIQEDAINQNASNSESGVEIDPRGGLGVEWL